LDVCHRSPTRSFGRSFNRRSRERPSPAQPAGYVGDYQKRHSDGLTLRTVGGREARPSEALLYVIGDRKETERRPVIDGGKETERRPFIGDEKVLLDTIASDPSHLRV
jgi:hypothetical protein